jgi:UDP-N-acetylglucosamine--N-acetylmuramyl-(pentapeptide) pyrophosphoryl-undecaprenol N-acetylglucosamine transferase
MNERLPHILIMAGGTGGHVFPGLALASVLRDRGCQVSWLGTSRGIEATLVPRAAIALHTLPISGLRGKRWPSLLLAPWKLGLSLWFALALMLRLRPEVVVGFGGFAAGPGGLMAAALGRTLLVHEQNAVAGLTNRWLAKVADRVFCAFPGSFADMPAATVIGNPVRRDIVALDAPEMRWTGRSGPLRLLVLGGSLGARTLNRVVPAALALLPEEQRPQIRHQAGDRTLDLALEAYESAGIDAEITAFIDDMAEAYGWADLVICRAGALTVSEVAAAGLPAIFVPYPHAVDDHQTANARFLVRTEAAWTVADADLTPEHLAGLMRSLRREMLLDHAVRARAAAAVDAAEILADACLDAVRGTS